MPSTPDDLTLPCGCSVEFVVVEGNRLMEYSPCSHTCEYFLYAMSEAESQGKPVEFE